MRVRLNIFKVSFNLCLKMNLNVSFIDVVGEMIEEALHVIVNEDPLVTYLSYGELRWSDLGSTINEMDSTFDSTPHLEFSSWIFTCEPLSPLASSPMHLMLSPHLNFS